MNYRHIFHAGNICDVAKHAVLGILISHLREKNKAFCVLDTHAGIGLYDLQETRAQKTNEARDGVYKLLNAPPLPGLEDYYQLLKKLNAGESFRYYPGSPLLTQNMLRSQDRLIACELHKEDFKALQNFVPQAQLHYKDGYDALRAFLPPEEKRGLVLIDPPYEEVNEFERLTSSVIEAYERWPQGIFMIWYPIKERPAIWRFHEALVASGIKKQLCAEFIYQQEVRGDRLNGGGHIIINPPWKLDEKLQALFPQLHQAMQTPHQGMDVKWLVGE